MAKICEYCGRELNDWEECNCPESVAARKQGNKTQADQTVSEYGTSCEQLQETPAGEPAQAPADEQEDYLNKNTFGISEPDINVKSGPEAVTENPDTQKSRAEEIFGGTGAEVAMDLKELCLGMFTRPVETLKENAKRKDHASSYIIAAVLSVFLFIVLAVVGDKPLINEAIGRGTLVIFSLSAAVAIFLFKAVYAACITLWGKKYNPDLKYSAALGTFCLLDIYDLVMLTAITFFTALSIYELSITILLFWIIIEAVSGIVAGWVLTEGRSESVIRINLIVLFVFLVLTVLCLRGIVIDMCAGALMVFMRTLAGF